MKEFLVLMLVAGSVLAQPRPPRRAVPPGALERSDVAVGYVPAPRPTRTIAKKAIGDAAVRTSDAADAAATPQAPGVMQIDLYDPSRSAWFVSTDVIPRGSTIVAFITPPGSIQQFLQLPLSVTKDLAPGTSLMFPQIRNLGDFWPSGVMTYDVLVKLPDGTNTHSLADFCTLCSRTFQGLQGVIPLIYSTSESLAADGSVVVTINGVFTSSPVKVVFEALPVPSAAITRDANNNVLVNVSQVPGMSLDLYQDFLLTVSQDGYADTRVFTHVPFAPGTYIPSP